MSNNPTPADAEKSPNWDDTLTPLLLDAMSKVYGYATYSDLCNDDDMPEVWSVADNIAKASEELQRQVQALMDGARKDENERWFQECKNVMSHAIYAARFRDRQYELSHPAPVTKSDKE